MYSEVAEVSRVEGEQRNTSRYAARRDPRVVGGPWLTVDRKQVIEIGADGFAKYRPASADDVSNGRVYNEAEFRASLTA